jgi:carnitine O-acetyltransferase
VVCFSKKRLTGKKKHKDISSLFNRPLYRQELPIERLKGGEPQCMWQYSRIFSVTRIPSYHCDTLFETDQKYRHIIVLVRDQIYKVNVYKELKDDIWQLMTTDEIERELYKVIADVHQRQPSAPVGVLSSWHRDKWTAARNHLLTLDPQNRQTTTEIESSLFAVALDDHSIGVQEKHLTRTMFCGHQGLGNGHNRWFDKSITLVVENTGACAFSGEHSPVDAFTVSFILDFMLEEPVTGTIESEWVEPHQGTAHHLPFVTDNIIARYIKEAEKDADAAASLSDPDVLVFDDYGTDWVKKVGRVPPDAYWQMSLQLAYYRIHHKLTPVYETASTRKYLHGRTETIRSCSMDSKAFLETFENPNATVSVSFLYGVGFLIYNIDGR